MCSADKSIGGGGESSYANIRSLAYKDPVDINIAIYSLRCSLSTLSHSQQFSV